jgi:mRNA interferase RelE/StbE
VNTEFTSSFLRDVRKLPDDAVRAQVRATIEVVEAAADLRAITNLKKLSGTGSYYRIRIGEYRIGLQVTGEAVIFVRVLPRREIYRYFP